MKYEANPVVVDAVRIEKVDTPDGSGFRLISHEEGSMFASPEMLARITPVPGDYVVTQADGYTYLNPKDVFERKYRPIKHGHPVAAAEMTPPPPDGPGSSTGQ